MTHFFLFYQGPEGMGGKGAWLGPANSTSSTRCCGPSSSSTPRRSCTVISSRVRPVAGPWGSSKSHHPRVSSESQNRGPPPGCNVVTFSENPSEGRGILRRLGGACYFPSTLFRREPAGQRQLRPADLRFWIGPRCAAFFFQSQEYRPLIDVDQIPNCTPPLFLLFLLLFLSSSFPTSNLLFARIAPCWNHSFL